MLLRNDIETQAPTVGSGEGTWENSEVSCLDLKDEKVGDMLERGKWYTAVVLSNTARVVQHGVMGKVERCGDEGVITFIAHIIIIIIYYFDHAAWLV